MKFDWVRTMDYNAGSYDIAVIGAGHAGIEAALAAARLGLKTVCFTVNLDAVGNMPCNPAIGGTGKGHLVRELDALGGEMARAADRACIQYRTLNRGKGPAVWSLRAQADRREYQKIMKHTLELQENLWVKQAEVTDLFTDESGAVDRVRTAAGAVYQVRAAVVCTGTYLGGRTIVGDVTRDSGPDGLAAALPLTQSLLRLGLGLRRFKTGTPPRVNARSVDFSKMEVQPGDETVVPFSFETREVPQNRAVCYLTYTNQRTHAVIRANLDRSPLFSGVIEGVGPRYCPSIEDKVVRFADKPRHQLFIEPCGENTEEMYLQGMSSSLPEEVQIAFYHTIKGLENVQIMRSAYAIEYDCVDPTQMEATLEFADLPGLYGAGQFNGSSGYEEAAAQGLVAGINAARKVLGLSPMILDRASSYIGTLVDDLITKGVSDPYRMMTSRSEYRLVLRQDNADERLTPIGHEIGLISESRWEKFCEKQAMKEAERKRVEKLVLSPTQELNDLLVSRETSPVTSGVHLSELLKRPQLNYAALAPVDKDRPDYPAAVFENVEIELKYEGYIRRQKADIAEMRRLEKKLLPKHTDYETIEGLRMEAREKLNKVRPANIGQASRISGVSPADISVLLIWLAKEGGEPIHGGY